MKKKTTPAKPVTAFIIRTNGAIELVVPANGTDFTLEEMNNIVNGYIEVVTFPRPVLISEKQIAQPIMIVNEEGKLNGSEYNQVASFLYRKVLGHFSYLHGDVLICEVNMVK
jgi:hypothetical protein